jgi:hypothetical protein
VQIRSKRFEYSLQNPGTHPLLETTVAGLVRRVALRQIGPRCAGRSTQSIPSRTARRAFHGRPRPSFRRDGSGISGSRTDHCESVRSRLVCIIALSQELRDKASSRLTLRDRGACKSALPSPLLHRNADRCTGDPGDGQQEGYCALGRIRRQAKVHLVSVHRAGISDRAQHLRAFSIDSHG